MDIQYLLFLQGLRDSWLGFIAPFMEILSDIIVSPASFGAAFIIFWCISKELGAWMLGSASFGNLINSCVKATACVYRPWIRDASVAPYGNAKVGATGYSFPSGHTEVATTIFAPAAGFLWNLKHKIWAVVCYIMIALVMFSRNFLGVHTPQDVVVSFVLSLAVVFLIRCISSWTKKGENRDVIVLVVGILIDAAFVVYASLKSYPMDYADGKLLMDPAVMMKDSYKSAGFFFGFIIAWFIERRYIKLSTDNITMKVRIVRGCVGIGICGVVFLVFHKLFKAICPVVMADAFLYAVVLFVAVAICPFVFKLIEKKLFNDDESAVHKPKHFA